MKNKLLKNVIFIIISAVFWIIVWWIAAEIIKEKNGSYLLLPTPLSVMSRLGRLVVTADYWKTIGLSLLRMSCGIIITILFGIVLAVVTERVEIVRILIAPIMNIVKSTPVASFIFLIFLWIDRNILPAVIAGMMVLPIIWENVSQGIRSTDKSLLDMAKVFDFSSFYKLKYLYLPAIKPYLSAGCRSAVSLGWKAGIAAEVIVIPVYSIGKMIFYSKQDIETVDLFAWTLTTVILSMIVEAIISLLSRRFEAERRKLDA